MYDTGGSYSVCQLAAPDDNLARRLNWLSFELSPDTERRRLVFEREQRHTLSMLRPLSTEEAYRWFGTFLGLFPPFALFAGFILNSGVHSDAKLIVALCVAMNAVCCLVGRKFGAFLGRKFGDPLMRSRTCFAFTVFFMALFWGAVTGGFGGALCFGFGAIFGIFFAVPIALAAFPVFAVLHRLLSHGGMIEERQVWPLAFGVPLTIAAMILSPWIR
jgi:hypothetical protein